MSDRQITAAARSALSVRHFTSTPRPALLLSALAAAGLLAACGKSGDGPGAAGGPPAMPPPQVSVVTVQAKDAPLTFEYTGQTAGSRETEVRARVGGIVQRRLFEEGATVKAGAALFQIDPANLQTTVASTEAAIGVAEARYNQAKRDNARLVPLIAEKAISQKEFDDSKSALETAEATLRQVRAQAAEAKLNLGYTRVVAPIGGVTGVAAKADGSLVNSTDMLTTIVQVNPIYVNFSVSEGDMLKLNKQIAAGQVAVPGGKSANGSAGFAVSVKLADGSTWPKQGKLNFTSEKLNPTTGSYDARAEIPNPDGALRPGQFVRVVLGGASRTQSITVPQRCAVSRMVASRSAWLLLPETKPYSAIRANSACVSVKLPFVPISSANSALVRAASRPSRSKTKRSKFEALLMSIEGLEVSQVSAPPRTR